MQSVVEVEEVQLNEVTQLDDTLTLMKDDEPQHRECDYNKALQSIA